MNKKEQLLKKYKGFLKDKAGFYYWKGFRYYFEEDDVYDLACKFLFEIHKEEANPSWETIKRCIDTGLKRELRKENKQKNIVKNFKHEIFSRYKVYKSESEIVFDIDRKNAEKRLPDFSRKVNKMIENGYKIKEIAKGLGVSPQYIYKVENKYIKQLQWLMSTGKRISFENK